MIGQPSRTTKTPPKKKLVAFALCLWKKNLNVRSRPMTKDRPETKRICTDSKGVRNNHRCDRCHVSYGGNTVNRLIYQRTFPMARRALSKNSIIPKKRKNTPNPVSPIPISVDFKKEEKLLNQLWGNIKSKKPFSGPELLQTLIGKNINK